MEKEKGDEREGKGGEGGKGGKGRPIKGTNIGCDMDV